MLFTNKDFETETVSPGRGSALGIVLGEAIPGGREVFIHVPKNTDDDLCGLYKDLTIGKTSVGYPRINEEKDNRIYAIFSSVSDELVKNDGRIFAPAEQEIHLMVRAINVETNGEGCIMGTSDTVLLRVSEGDSYQVKWDNGVTTYYRVLRDEIIEIEQSPVKPTVFRQSASTPMWRPV